MSSYDVALAAAHNGDLAALTLLLGPDRPIEVTETALQLPTDVSYDEYEAIGRLLGRVNRSCGWWVGDWIVFGEDVFPDGVHQAALLTGLSPGTCANRASVARRIPPEHRYAGMSVSAHVAVSPLAPDERQHLLEEAAVNDWPVETIRIHVRDRLGREPVPSLADVARHVVLSSRRRLEIGDTSAMLLEGYFVPEPAMRALMDKLGMTSNELPPPDEPG